MAHAKRDSEVTSFAPSSPERFPLRPPPYFVQSPSRDSHDGDKTPTTTTSTTPAASPPRYHSDSLGRHSRESSTSRFSGAINRISPNNSGDGAAVIGGRRGLLKAWREPLSIEEEGLLEGDEELKGIPRRCYVAAFVLGFVIIFFFFALILWGASRNQRPVVTMKSITFENFIIQAGTDSSLVPTALGTLNSTLKMNFRNKGTFFGVHVTSSSIAIDYKKLTMATGKFPEFYQGRKSQRLLTVAVGGRDIPLYGVGASLTSSPAKNSPSNIVPFSLSLRLRSTAYVLGNLVKPKFYTNVQCNILMDQRKLNTPISLSGSACKYGV